MGKVFTHMTMSLDGFIADPNDQVGELFDWYEAGDVTVPTPNEGISFQVDDASAEMLRELTGNTGALVSGRRLFDIANGWDDNHPAGAPVVVVTHRAPEDAAKRWPRTTFVDGVEPRSPRPDRSPATRTSPSPARRSPSRHSTSAWWMRCVSASCRCCSARGSHTSRSWTGATSSSTTRSSSRDAVPFTCDTRSDGSLDPHRWIEAS
jgi:hypothetical protein